jgi:[ribosomal protein S18]-alanine N-acetyltransferase
MTRPPLLVEAASEADVAALVDLEARCHSHPWSERSFREELDDAATGQLLVLRRPFDAADPGRGIVAYGAYRVVAGEMHVLNLAVAPEHRRLGLGSFLLARVLEQGSRHRAERVLLEVRRSNTAAQALYERFGFVTLAARRDYYQEPREDALVLVRSGGLPASFAEVTGS